MWLLVQLNPLAILILAPHQIAGVFLSVFPDLAYMVGGFFRHLVLVDSQGHREILAPTFAADQNRHQVGRHAAIPTAELLD